MNDDKVRVNQDIVRGNALAERKQAFREQTAQRLAAEGRPAPEGGNRADAERNLMRRLVAERSAKPPEKRQAARKAAPAPVAAPPRITPAWRPPSRMPTVLRVALGIKK